MAADLKPSQKLSDKEVADRELRASPNDFSVLNRFTPSWTEISTFLFAGSETTA
jgi:hypothetical protein